MSREIILRLNKYTSLFLKLNDNSEIEGGWVKKLIISNDNVPQQSRHY